MIKKVFINILVINLMGILLFPIMGSAHTAGGDNPPEEVHRVIEVLFRLDPAEVHDEVTHNRNNYGAPRWFTATPCDGYEGGHAGYDVAHSDDDAPFYSLTAGEVINVKHPNPNNIKELSYIAIYNTDHNKTVLYLHPSVIDVEKGDPVWVGRPLGKQGNTGFSYNPHVHLEVRKNRSLKGSCGIRASQGTDRPNENPIPFLYEQAKDFGEPPSDPGDDIVNGRDLPNPDGKIYWGDAIIQRANLNGTDVEDLITTEITLEGIALDVSGGKMYWTDLDEGKIQCANLDGTQVEDLIGGLRSPRGIALDVSGGKMYWTDSSEDKIQCANLDGTQVEDLIDGLRSPRGIALDVSGGKMYWTDSSEDKIQRANLDGTQVEDLVTDGLRSPRGIALDVSGGKMYWTDSGADKIQRANLDGTQVEDLVTDGLRSPMGIALDVSGGKMYWTDSSEDKIQCANLDGTQVEDLITEVGSWGIALDVSGGGVVGTPTHLYDVNGDGVVDVQDLVRVAQQYRQTGNNAADVNKDKIVNVVDLILVAGAVDKAAAAPSIRPQVQALFPAEQRQQWLIEARALGNKSLTYQRGLVLLEQLFAPSIPKKTVLLSNYPNPFNPETWIPYQLAESADVTLTIYDVKGQVVRTLALGHQPAGVYQSRSRAAYWDGENELGESVASGVYFYTLTAGEFKATRKLLIRK